MVDWLDYPVLRFIDDTGEPRVFHLTKSFSDLLVEFNEHLGDNNPLQDEHGDYVLFV